MPHDNLDTDVQLAEKEPSSSSSFGVVLYQMTIQDMNVTTSNHLGEQGLRSCATVCYADGAKIDIER